jgi:hypothetical protein
MQTFQSELWTGLIRLVEADDGPGITAWAAPLGDSPSAVLRWHHPEDEDERTLLMLSYWWGKASAAKALVNAGADYQQQDAKGRGAAWYAQRFGKGAREIEMSNAIGAAVRRISMESVIDGTARKAPEETTPPKRRRHEI